MQDFDPYMIHDTTLTAVKGVNTSSTTAADGYIKVLIGVYGTRLQTLLLWLSLSVTDGGGEQQ